MSSIEAVPARAPRTLNRYGFTLVELLLVIVVLGVLAAVAVPRYTTSRERAYVATMKSDLRNLAIEQEIYFYDDNHFVYAGDLGALGFTPSRGVAISISNVSSTGWSATATHSSTKKSCAVYHGSAVQVSAASETGGGPGEELEGDAARQLAASRDGLVSCN